MNDNQLITEAYRSKKLNEDFSSLGNDAEGGPVEIGHIVQLVDSPNPEKQYVVYGPEHGPHDEAMVDIIELGEGSISQPTQRLKVIGSLGDH